MEAVTGVTKGLWGRNEGGGTAAEGRYPINTHRDGRGGRRNRETQLKHPSLNRRRTRKIKLPQESNRGSPILNSLKAMGTKENSGFNNSTLWGLSRISYGKHTEI